MVKFVEAELAALKKEVNEMWTLVYDQIANSRDAVLALDKTVAQQIIAREKRVNSYDLKIDSDVEDFIALYNPVAIDLRFALAILHINNNLERIGDYAEGMARFVLATQNKQLDKILLTELRLEEMFEQVLSMLATTQKALQEEDLQLANSVFEKDNLLDEINTDSIHILTDYALQHPESTRLCLELTGVFRKLERSGDHINNLAEETIFYIDAKVLKHRKSAE